MQSKSQRKIVVHLPRPPLIACCFRLGTIDFMAPEVLDCPPKPLRLIGPGAPARGLEAADNWAANKGYTNKVDCWSVGVLAYELLLGVSPFAGVSASARGDAVVWLCAPPWCGCIGVVMRVGQND